MTNYRSEKSYLAVKVQSAATTPVIPNFFIPLISESIRLKPNIEADRRMKGISWKADDMIKGARQIEGMLKVFGGPETIGHILNMCYEKGNTTGDADGYTHPFTPGEAKSYCIEISRGIYAERIFGAKADNLKLSFEDNKLVAEVSVKALGKFYCASLAVALTGAGMTSAVLKTDSDLRPADGLVIGDVINVGGVDVTLTSVNANGTTVGFASTAITAAVGDPLYLKAQAPSYGANDEPLYLSNALVGISDTSANADTAAATKATATPCYELSTELKNNLLDAPASGSYGPAALLGQTREAQAEVSRLFETPIQYQKWIEKVKQAMTWIITGRYIKSDLSTSEKLTIKFHNIKMTDNEEPLEVGQYLFDKQKFEALYDTGESKSIEISLINRTAGTSY